MKKIEIQKRIDARKEFILSKTKEEDRESIKSVIDELLNIKGELDVKPLEYNVGERVDSYDGEVFEIVKTTEGVYFKTYGGLMLFARPNISSLYQTLTNIIDQKDVYEKLEGEQKDNFDMTLDIIAYICTLPMYAFQDAEFSIDIATKVVEYLSKMVEDAANTPLQDETPEENEEFRSTMESVETLNKLIDNEDE